MLLHVALFDGTRQRAPPALLHAHRHALGRFLCRPPGRKQVRLAFGEVQEASKSREAVAGAAVDAVVGDLAFEIEIIRHSKAVGVDEELVHVLLRAVM